MLTSLISFSSRNTFSIDLLLKASVVYAKVCMIFSLWSTLSIQRHLRNFQISVHQIKFSASTWFIHVDGLSNYLLPFQKNPSTNFFKNNCYFPDQKHGGHCTNIFTEKGLDFYIKYLLRAIQCGFCCRECIFSCYYYH